MTRSHHHLGKVDKSTLNVADPPPLPSASAMARLLLLACILPAASSFMPMMHARPASAIRARSASLEPLSAEARDGTAVRDACDAFDRRQALRRAVGGAMALVAPLPATAFGDGDAKTKPTKPMDETTIAKSVVGATSSDPPTERGRGALAAASPSRAARAPPLSPTGTRRSTRRRRISRTRRPKRHT